MEVSKAEHYHNIYKGLLISFVCWILTPVPYALYAALVYIGAPGSLSDIVLRFTQACWNVSHVIAFLTILNGLTFERDLKQFNRARRFVYAGFIMSFVMFSVESVIMLADNHRMLPDNAGLLGVEFTLLLCNLAVYYMLGYFFDYNLLGGFFQRAVDYGMPPENEGKRKLYLKLLCFFSYFTAALALIPSAYYIVVRPKDVVPLVEAMLVLLAVCICIRLFLQFLMVIKSRRLYELILSVSG